MLIKLPTKEAYVKFIRTITSLIVGLLSRLKNKNLKGLFDLRPYTRILSDGWDFWNVVQYHLKNDLEARGFGGKKKNSGKKKTKSRESS